MSSGGGGDWLLIQELFERGEPLFVDALRRFDNADLLGAFASRCFDDKRPEARQLLLDYLDRPLNAFRHEPLVKRLFKLAEAAGDDELMGRFLVAFDRSVRRVVRQHRRYRAEVVGTEHKANNLAAKWREQGLESVSVYQTWQRKYQVSAQWTEPRAATPLGSTMPRDTLKETTDFSSWDRKSRQFRKISVPEWVLKLNLVPRDYRTVSRIPDKHRKALEKSRLFSLATRYYLRRRSWRYFRRLGRLHPERYIPAVTSALLQYRDDDVVNSVALLDNWGLTQILFHFSPYLRFDEGCCRVASGQTLAKLEPAPIHARLWRASPRSLVDLLIRAKCRTVRGWAIRMIQNDLATVLQVFSIEERLGLLTDDDPDVVEFAAELLRDDPLLKEISPGQWLHLAETANPVALDVLCELMARLIAPEEITLAEAVRLATSRPFPLARLGLLWLRTKILLSDDDCRLLLGLGEAECEAIRPDLIRWAAEVLSQSTLFRSDWVLEWLDSRHQDVRDAAMNWFRGEPRAHDDLAIWQRLMETPYDDVRLALINDLESRTHGAETIRLEQQVLDPDLLKLLWASVLLNVFRGNRAKPVVVRQLVARIEQQPADLPRLLPLLAVALRSIRGPEWRAGLAAVVRLTENSPNAVPLIREAFPELQLA